MLNERREQINEDRTPGVSHLPSIPYLYRESTQDGQHLQENPTNKGSLEGLLSIDTKLKDTDL
jgi:hypothetical protein